MYLKYRSFHVNEWPYKMEIFIKQNIKITGITMITAFKDPIFSTDVIQIRTKTYIKCEPWKLSFSKVIALPCCKKDKSFGYADLHLWVRYGQEV